MGSPDASSSLIQQVRGALLVASAAGAYLDAVGNNRGVPRPDNTSDDELYRRVIQALAWLPKSLLISYYSVIAAILGTQQETRLRVGRSWKVYEVNANEIILELPAELIFSAPEVSSYLHGVSGYAGVASGPSNTFTTPGDVRAGSATTLVGLAVQVFFNEVWNDYTISSVSYNAGTDTSTVVVSAATIPSGGGQFSIVVPGDGVASYRGDYLAAGGLQTLYSTMPGPLTSTLSVVGDVTDDVAPGMAVLVAVGGALQSRVVGALSYSATANYPATAAATAAAVGGGTWSAGWLCEDPAVLLLAAFGGTNLPENAGGGSPQYQVPGPLGDLAVRVTVANTGWGAASAAFLDPGATMDICGVVVCRTALPLSENTTILSKTDFAGGPGFEVFFTTGATVGFQVDHTTPGNVSVSVSVAEVLTNNEWCAVMFGLDRAAGTMRIAAQSLASGVQFVSASQPIGSLGSVSNAGAPFRVSRGGGLGNTLDFAAAYMGVGVGVAAGIPANIGARLASFCASLGAPNVTRVTLTTTDVPGGQVNQPFVVPQEAADTATTPSHADRVYLAGQGLLDVVTFYINLLVRAAGIVLRVEIV